MRVVELTRFGGPEVLVPGSAPAPEAGADEVVVKIAVAGITFVDTQIRRGVDEWHEVPEPPYVPGGIVAGVVIATGKGVDTGWLGRRVLADPGMTGSFAEQAAAPVESLIAVPEALGFADAVALHTDGSTALGLVEGARVQPGEVVLVEAAAGGVGSLLVQLAKSRGARVIGAARGARKLDLARSLGADVVVDYSTVDWTAGLGPVDVVFDGVGGEIGRAAFGLVRPGGRFSVHGASSGSVSSFDASGSGVEVLGIEQLFGFGEHARAWAERVLAEAAAGRLRPVVGQSFPLERAADAHAAIETRGALGKTLLLME
ncbi:zinc-binding dehydrogenase [Allokutzneria albata]|uniref:NADPH2:quinone reductase n=1 Tax=Allokutzneria albata TaxID=211114 RepID=A0A1G9T995_ALLAB|nr:zinc-binding dehydrogenase [Allokutzneria albata]SDM44231.1 NADPH2:quinone reductase [Allokutzneria albata]